MGRLVRFLFLARSGEDYLGYSTEVRGITTSRLREQGKMVSRVEHRGRHDPGERRLGS